MTREELNILYRHHETNHALWWTTGILIGLAFYLCYFISNMHDDEQRKQECNHPNQHVQVYCLHQLEER